MSEELTKTKLLPIQGKDMDSIMQNLETGVAELFTSERLSGIFENNVKIP